MAEKGPHPRWSTRLLRNKVYKGVFGQIPEVLTAVRVNTSGGTAIRRVHNVNYN